MSEIEPAAPGEGRARGWPRTLVALWLLRRVTRVPRGSALPWILASSLGLLAAWTGIDWWQRQPDPVFVVDGIPMLAWYALAPLLVAWMLWSRAAPRPAFGAVLLLSLGLLPLPLIVMAALAPRVETVWLRGVAVAVTLHAEIYLARGLRLLTGRSQPWTAVMGAVLALGFVLLSDATNAIPDLWNPADGAVAVSDDELAQREMALFEQADRIDRALEAVHRDASSRPRAFFLGFAGVGDEQVFAGEVGLASRVIGERYATQERQLSLINDERDLDAAPLASVSGLVYALHGLAPLMKRDRDVLFLVISSHGSPDPAIAVANSQFPFTDLSPEELASALRDSGIEWRVVIISACYAGGFIDALRDAHTIVLTAAAADRTSFGCANDRDLTYFGEAFYRDALPEAASLRAAFEKAKAALALRERAEGETPSNPQGYFGFELEQRLGRGGERAVGTQPRHHGI